MGEFSSTEKHKNTRNQLTGFLIAGCIPIETTYHLKCHTILF